MMRFFTGLSYKKRSKEYLIILNCVVIKLASEGAIHTVNIAESVGISSQQVKNILKRAQDF